LLKALEKLARVLDVEPAELLRSSQKKSQEVRSLKYGDVTPLAGVFEGRAIEHGASGTVGYRRVVAADNP